MPLLIPLSDEVCGEGVAENRVWTLSNCDIKRPDNLDFGIGQIDRQGVIGQPVPHAAICSAPGPRLFA